jgi:hypothetical protein
VDFYDFAKLTQYWPDANCATLNDCYGTDLNIDGNIDLYDLEVMADHWLNSF